MCNKKDTCPMYLEHCSTGKMSDVCKNCVYLLKAQKVSRYAQIGLVIAVIAFLVSTYLLY